MCRIFHTSVNISQTWVRVHIMILELYINDFVSKFRDSQIGGLVNSFLFIKVVMCRLELFTLGIHCVVVYSAFSVCSFMYMKGGVL